MLWNYTTRTIENNSNRNDENYNVAKLRSLYATLLTAIAPAEEPRSTPTNLFSNVADSELNDLHQPNFRTKRSRIFTDDNAEDEISFETFHHPSANSLDSIKTWKHLSATKTSASREMDDSYSFSDNEAAVASLIQARKVEARVVELIRSLGEVVVYGEQRINYVDKITRTVNSGNEAVFEYFCDKNILSLLVEIVQAKPNTGSQSQYSGVVWTALVKAQVLQTISILISNVSDPTSLYYLLSNNYINDVVASVIPLQQWSDDALDEILPVYISFLKTLALQLAKSPNLFQFYCDQHGSSSTLPPFPLFYAAIEVASSPLSVVRADNFVCTTALNIILNLFQLPVEEIRSVIADSYTEQKMLLSHLSNEIVNQYENIVDILIGPRIDLERNQLLSANIAMLEDTLHFVNDLLWCSQRSVNVRFCEIFMQTAIMNPILENLSDLELIKQVHHQDSKSWNGQTCEEDEARCSAGIIVLSKVYSTMDYIPLLKMISIALLHPYSPSTEQMDAMKSSGKEFIVTPSLNAIAQNEYVVVAEMDSPLHENSINFSNAIMEDISTTRILNSPNKTDAIELSVAAVPNPSRRVILELLTGSCGDRMFTVAAILFEIILKSKATDFKLVKKLNISPNYFQVMEKSGHDSSLEISLEHYFESVKNTSSSLVGIHANDCAISLMLCYLPYHLKAATDGGLRFDKVEHRMQNFKLLTGIESAKKHFANECKRLKNSDGVDIIFNDLMEAEIGRLFSVVDSSGPKLKFKCDLESLSSALKKDITDAVVHPASYGKSNEVEDARFAIRRLLLLQSLHNVVAEVQSKFTGLLGPSSVKVSPRWSDNTLSPSTICVASEEIVALGCLDKQTIVGTDEAVKGRTHFFFTPSLAITDKREDRLHTIPVLGRGGIVSDKDKRRVLADTIIVHSSSKTTMILVVDNFELLVLKPKSKDEMESGTVLCSTLLNNVIAVATDGDWLHIAMRNVEDVGVLVKKGNMAMRFDNAGICNQAKGSIITSLATLKRSLSSKIDNMLNDVVI